MKRDNMKTQSFGRLCRTAFVSIVAGLSAFSARAHATLAAWDGFKNVADGDTRHGVSLHLEGNTVNADGSITIGSRGLWLTRTCGTFGNATSGKDLGVTVIAEVSDVPVPASGIGGLLSVPINNLAETWAGVDAGGKVTLSWSASSPETAATVLGSGTHFVALGYKNSRGSGVIVDGVEVVTSTAQSSSGMLQSEIHVGEHKTYGSPEISGVLTGLAVKRLAIVNDRLTAEEVAAYCANGIGRPDATQQADYARFQANFADRVFTWRSPVSNVGDGTFCKFGRFDLATGLDASVVGSTDQITMPGYVAPVTEIMYRGLSSVYVPNGPYGSFYGYSTPGLVLRFPAHGGDYITSVLAQIPLNLGGLLVEEGAFGGVNPNSSTASPINIFTGPTEYRTTDLGDTSGSVPSWFILHENVVLNRKDTTKIWGEANFVLDAGKTFDCTSDKADAVVSLQTGASLVCHGKGHFKVRTLTATAENACLDWSDLEIDNAHPFIEGNLTVSASTKLILPAAAKETKRFTLCSGSLTGEFPAAVQVGGETVTGFTVANNTLIFSTTTEFTGEGETSWSTPSAWSDGVPQPGDIAKIPAGKTVLVSTSDDLAGITVIGEGRVAYVGCQPGAERTGYCEQAWTGTVEIRNLDLSGEGSATAQTLDFAGFSNSKSSIALNGVISAMWTNGSDVKNPTFNNLEIGESGWTSTTPWYSASPVYTCNLTGTGTLTSKQTESNGTVNFIGDHSAFAGSVVNVSGSRKIALLKTGATALPAHGGAGARTILIGEGVNVTVADGKTWQAANGFVVQGTVGGAGTLSGPVNFNGGAVCAGSGALTLDGVISGSPVLDAQSVFDSGSFDACKILVATAEGRPAFAVRSASGFAAYWQENELWVRDEARIALYGNYVGKSVLTWDGTGTLGAKGGAQRYVGFDAETLKDTEEVLTADDSWHAFWSGATDGKYRPGAVLRLARGRGKPMNIDDYVPWSFGGIIVEPGATGYSMTINSGTRDINFGDQANSDGVSWTMVYENFTVNRGPQGHGTFFGVCNLYVDAGKVFSLNANTETKDNPVVNPGATLKLHGAGTLKVSNLIAADATLDFSDLSAARATPFVDGALTINRKTVIVFPDGFDIAGSYQLCSGTLNAPARPFTATVVVDGVSQRRKISVGGNCVSCSDPDGMSIFIR